MSAKKIKKQQKNEELEINFIKILRFMAWTYIVVILIIAAYFLLKAAQSVLTSDTEIITAIGNAFTYPTLIFWLLSGINAGFLFSTASQIKENPAERKQMVFKNFVISMILVGIITIWVISWYNVTEIISM